MTDYTFVGACAILKYQNKPLFEIQKLKHWHRENGIHTIGLSCIGGRMEQGETLHQNLPRDARLTPIGTAQYLVDIHQKSPELLRPLNL